MAPYREVPGVKPGSPNELSKLQKSMRPNEYKRRYTSAIKVRNKRTEKAGPTVADRYKHRAGMASPSTSFQASPGKPADPRPVGRGARKKSAYNKSAPDLLYCDPQRLEYYEDGSIRIFDQDIIKGMYVWAAEHGMNNGLKDGDVLVNGRGC